MRQPGSNPASEAKHLVIAAGGTGGHFLPALATAAEWQRRGGRVTLLLAGQQLRQQLDNAREQDLTAMALPAVRLPRTAGAAVLFPGQLLGAVCRALRILGRLRPDVVLGMGSFAAFPACAAALLRQRPLVLHEANARVGRANRILSRRARRLATSLPLVPGQRLGCPQLQTGLPLRPGLVAAAGTASEPAAARRALGLDPVLPLLLVFGGSQGAQALNRLMREAVPQLGRRPPWQAIHLTGVDDNTALASVYAAAGVPALVQRAESHIERCYQAADLVLCRAGAATVTELALFGKPAILVPLPSAADDHQTANALVLEEAGGGRLLAQAAATPAALAALLRAGLTEPNAHGSAPRALTALVRTDAAAQLADLLFETCA